MLGSHLTNNWSLSEKIFWLYISGKEYLKYEKEELGRINKLWIIIGYCVDNMYSCNQ